MALVLADRVQETTTTTGTGTLTLAGAVAGFQSFSVIGNGNTVYYTITSGNDWEVGLGTYTSSGTTLSRDTVYASSASGAKISVVSGAKVFCTYPAGKSVGTNTGYFQDNFAGTFVDGIVVDYDPVAGNGRFSVGTADKFTFYNGGVAGTVLGSIATNGDWSITRFLDIGNGTLIGGATNPILAAAGSANQYIQAYVHNDLAGTSASSDLACYPDNGTDASGWIDMGITSSSFSDANYSITGPNEGYIFMSALSGSGKTGNLVYATDSTGTSNAHQWYSGGFNAAKSSWEMQLNSTGLALNVPLTSNVTTGTAPFVVASTTQVANLNAATAGTATTATNATNVANTGAVSTNASFYPTFVAANTTSNQAHNTSAGLSFNPSTGVLSSTALALAAGTASVAPLSFTSGTNLTTAAAGAMEYDGTVPYFSIAASTRGAVPTEQWVVLTGTNTLTSQTGVQPIFDGGGGPTNGQVTLPVGTYQYECSYAATGLSATSGSFGWALGGTATKTFTYQAQASKAGTALTTPMATNSTFGTAAITTLVANSTGTVANLLVKGIIRVTVAGTVIPQISLTVASAAIIQAGSYFRVSPIGNSTVATVGNWS